MLEESLKKELFARARALEANAGDRREAAYNAEEDALRKRIEADKMDIRATECRNAALAIPDDQDDDIPF